MDTFFIPSQLGVRDPHEIGEALLAYRHALTREEIRLLRLIMAGLTNEEIAPRMRLAELGSVKSRVETLFSKLGVKRRTAAAVIGGDYGLRAENVLQDQPNGSR